MYDQFGIFYIAFYYIKIPNSVELIIMMIIIIIKLIITSILTIIICIVILWFLFKNTFNNLSFV